MKTPKTNFKSPLIFSEILAIGSVSFFLFRSPYLGMVEKVLLACICMMIAIFRRSNGVFFSLLISALQLAVVEITLAFSFFLFYAMLFSVFERNKKIVCFYAIALAPLAEFLGLGHLAGIICGIIYGPVWGLAAGALGYLSVDAFFWLDTFLLRLPLLKDYQEALRISLGAWYRYSLSWELLRHYLSFSSILCGLSWGIAGLAAGYAAKIKGWPRYLAYLLPYLAILMFYWFILPFSHYRRMAMTLGCIYSYAFIFLENWGRNNIPSFFRVLLSMHDSLSSLLDRTSRSLRKAFMYYPQDRGYTRTFFARSQKPEFVFFAFCPSGLKASIKLIFAYWLPVFLMLVILNTHLETMKNMSKEMGDQVKYYDALIDLIHLKNIIFLEIIKNGTPPQDMEAWLKDNLEPHELQILFDPWEKRYSFEKTPGMALAFRIVSCGPDGEAGTSDDIRIEYCGN